ncbi:MAG: hypothetical protein ACR2M2_03745 [Gaiellaceae bacterium]
MASLESWAANEREETLATVAAAALDELAFAEPWDQGGALTVEEAVALALRLPPPRPGAARGLQPTLASRKYGHRSRERVRVTDAQWG